MKNVLLVISLVLILVGAYLAITGITSDTRHINSALKWTFLEWSESRTVTGILSAFAGLCVFIVSRVVANR